MKILIISGDIDEIVTLYPVFTQKSFDVVVEMYGKDGVVSTHGFMPDVIFVDIVLKQGLYVPVLEWRDVVKELKSSNETKNIPVIILGNLLMDEIILDAKILGVSEVLDRTKVTIDEMVNMCKNIYKNNQK